MSSQVCTVKELFEQTSWKCRIQAFTVKEMFYRRTGDAKINHVQLKKCFIRRSGDFQKSGMFSYVSVLTFELETSKSSIYRYRNVLKDGKCHWNPNAYRMLSKSWTLKYRKYLLNQRKYF